MTHQEAIEKAQKLLRLTTSNNPHEAALAASRAQEIMDRYQLGNLALEYEQRAPEEPIKDFGNDPLDPDAKQHATWRSRLASALGRNNACKVYRQYNGTLGIIGRPSDVASVRYLFSWLRQEVDRLAQRDCVGNGRTYANNFRIGVVETIADRLAEQKKQTEAAVKQEAANPLALVRVENAIAIRTRQALDVEKWAQANMNFHKSPGSGYRTNDGAREAGRRAGNEVRIQPTKGALQ